MRAPLVSMLLLAWAISPAQEPPGLAITNVTVIDGRGNAAPGMTVLDALVDAQRGQAAVNIHFPHADMGAHPLKHGRQSLHVVRMPRVS